MCCAEYVLRWQTSSRNCNCDGTRRPVNCEAILLLANDVHDSRTYKIRKSQTAASFVLLPLTLLGHHSKEQLNANTPQFPTIKIV